jgi:hypothetical protein
MHSMILPPPVPYPPRYIIDPVAFFVALIGGPLLFTALSFWALFIPVFALGLGGPLYLVIGTPLLLCYLRRNDGDPGDLAALAFKVMVLALVPITLLALLIGEKEVFGFGFAFSGFGMIFGPAWAYFSGWIYQRLRREFFAKPRSF